MTPLRGCRIFVAAGLLCVAGSLLAQNTPFSAALLPDVRRAASLVPGDAPIALNVVTLNPFRITIASMVDGGSADSADAGYPVFQIRFRRGWITVDAALDREFVPRSRTFSD